MTEDEAKQVLLVRAVEEEDPALVQAEVKDAAWNAAESRDPLEPFVVRRAAFVLERLPAGARRLLRFELPPRDLALVVVAAAAGLGLASNGLSLGRRIHVLANPVTALVCWNLALYAAAVWAYARTPGRNATATGRAPLRPVLFLLARAGAGWARLRGADADRASAPDSGASRRTRVRFASDYAATCTAPILARFERLAHVAAIAFAAGALAGIHFQGIAFEYRMEWGSTLVSTPEMRAQIAALLFLPARLVLGADFPDAAQFALAATQEGAPAAIWFRVFAITVASFVAVPRTLLAASASLRARRLARNVPLPAGDPYWPELAERGATPAGAPFGKSLISHFALDAPSCSLLASLEAALVADDIGATSTGGPFDTLALKKAWFERWRARVEQGFSTFPDDERPRVVARDGLAPIAERVRRGENRFAPELVLLELAGFDAYWPLDPRDVGWRERLGLAPSIQRHVRTPALERASLLLGLPADEGERLRAALSATARELTGLRSKLLFGAAAGTAVGALTLGLAAPVAAGMVGKAVGVAGLAALKTGLAALGGHAVVGAGLGAAGGTALVAGGGVLLGPSRGGDGAAGTLTPAGALASGAKIEVFLRTVVDGRHREPATFAGILDELRSSVARLRDELPDFRANPSHTTKQVQEREKVIAILERVTERNEDWGRRHGLE